MKTITKLAAIAAATVVTATPAFAAPVSDANGSAKVKIVRGLTLTNTGEIDFGTIVLPTVTESATLTVAPDGTFGGCTGTFACSIANGATTTVESYSLSGTRAVNVVVNVPKTATIYVDGVNTNPSLDVTLATDLGGTVADGGATWDHTIQLPNSGAAGSAAALGFKIGGSINVSDTTTDGAYSGSFTVSADYE